MWALRHSVMSRKRKRKKRRGVKEGKKDNVGRDPMIGSSLFE
jgi:hypothetical protein